MAPDWPATVNGGPLQLLIRQYRFVDDVVAEAGALLHRGKDDGEGCSRPLRSESYGRVHCKYHVQRLLGPQKERRENLERGGRPVCVMLTGDEPECIPTRLGRKYGVPLDQARVPFPVGSLSRRQCPG